MTALVTYNEQWAALATQFKTQVPVTAGDKGISCKGGVFSLGEEQIGTLMCAVILDSIAINTYYEGEWVDGQKSTPKCYAYGRPPEEMKPHVESMQLHPDIFYPQTLNPVTGEVGACASCRWNQYGTASRGAGKACQNRDRLALLPAGMFVQQRGGFGQELKLFDDPAHFATTPVHKFSLPVTSVKNWREFANKVISTTGRPPFGVIAVIEAAPHPKFQTEIKFHLQELVPDHLFQTITQRYGEVSSKMVEPFSPVKEEQAEPPAQPGFAPRGAVTPQTAQGLRR